jgi:hypothetical protein
MNDRLNFPEALRHMRHFTGIFSLFLLNSYFPEYASDASMPQPDCGETYEPKRFIF